MRRPDLRLPHSGLILEASRLLRARALYKMGGKKWESAWNDIFAMRRLGHLIGNQPNLYDGAAAIGVHDMTCYTVREFVHAAENREIEWGDKLKQWGSEFRSADLGRQFDFGERLGYLRMITQIADEKVGAFESTQRMMGRTEIPEFAKSIDETLLQIDRKGGINWNEGMRWANTYYDRLTEYLSNKDLPMRIKKIRQLRQQLNQLEDSMTPASLLSLGNDNSSADEKAMKICGILLLMSDILTEQLINSEMRSRSYQKVVAIALASMQFKSQHGHLPHKCDDLKDQFTTSEVFLNSVDGQPLILEQNDDVWSIHFVLLTQALRIEIPLK